jgi:Winged helix DNA-binding domain
VAADAGSRQVAARPVGAQRPTAGRVTMAPFPSERFAAQLLTGKLASSPADVARRLLAVQAQDARGARLAIRARTSGLSAADVDRALTEDRSLIITWLNRGTLHLVRSEDYWWLHRLTVRPQLHAGCLRILAGSGVCEADADKGVAVVGKALAANGPLTRPHLANLISSAGLPASAALHVMMLTSLRGIAVRGPMVGAQHAYVHVRDWLGEPPPEPEPEVALGWLARRYLAGHGPASDSDLAKWAGIPVGQARRGLAAIGAGLKDRPDGLAELRGGAPEAGLPPARLLGAFDPLLLGWASREPILGDRQEIVTSNGLFRPFALVNGVAAGTWAWTGGRAVLTRWARLPEPAESALAAEAQDVRRYLAAERELDGADNAATEPARTDDAGSAGGTP